MQKRVAIPSFAKPAPTVVGRHGPPAKVIHEFGEMITDPLRNSWRADLGSEIADVSMHLGAQITDAAMHLGNPATFTIGPSERQALNQGVSDILSSPAMAPQVAESLANDPSYTDAQKAQADAPTRAKMYWDSLGLTDHGHQTREAITRQVYAQITGAGPAQPQEPGGHEVDL